MTTTDAYINGQAMNAVAICDLIKMMEEKKDERDTDNDR